MGNTIGKDTITLTVKVETQALYLKQIQATVEEGEFKGTTYCTNVGGGGSPIVDVQRDGKHVATVSVNLQELMHQMIDAAVRFTEADAATDEAEARFQVDRSNG